MVPRTPAADPWPSASDPGELLNSIADWLGGYGNPATRRTYAEGLGLPAGPADLRDWLATPHEQWTTAVARYAAVLGTATSRTGAATEPGSTGPPPAARGRLRHLHWFRWCATHDTDPRAATAAHVKAWLQALDQAGAAIATRDRMLATVKALYAHLADAGLTDGNPAALDRRRLGLVKPAGNTSATVVLTAGQVRALYAAAARRRRGAGPTDTARATAVVALCTLGLRVSELCGLDRADLHVTRGRRALRVRGKGGKARVVYLHAAAERALTEHLRMTERTTLPARRDTTGASAPLLVTRTGGRYRRQAIWQLLRRLASATGDAGLAGAMHPHALRHFYVTTAVEAGAQLVHVQADVGHTSVDTTEQVYNSAARDPARSAVDLVAEALRLG